MFDTVTGAKQASAMTYSYNDEGGLVRHPENLKDRIVKGLTPEPMEYRRPPTKDVLAARMTHPLLKSPLLAPVAMTIASSTLNTNVKPEWVAAMIFNESGGKMDPRLSGDSGKAKGITQIQNVAWNDKRYQQTFKETHGRAPNRNSLDDQVRMGTIILAQLHDEWNGNPEYMFRAYNSGSASLRDQLRGKRKDGAKNSKEYWNKIKSRLAI
jgi:type VI protein secretion system component Hcp